jgi:hypothetical protein
MRKEEKKQEKWRETDPKDNGEAGR